MYAHAQTPKTPDCNGEYSEETCTATTMTTPSGMETYVVVFIVLVIGNSVTNVVYKVTFATGSLADIFRSIVTNM